MTPIPLWIVAVLYYGRVLLGLHASSTLRQKANCESRANLRPTSAWEIHNEKTDHSIDAGGHGAADVRS
jgi:hypothetical protein